MRILLVSLFFVEYALELANALAKKNQVHLLLVKKRVSETVGDQINERFSRNLSYTLLPYRSMRHASLLKVIFSIFRTYISFRPEVVHIQECGIPLNFLFFLFRSKRVVATVHDVILHPGIDTYSQKSLKKSSKFWLIRKLRQYGYDKIILHGEYLKRQFLDHYKKPAQDIFVIPHGPLFSFRIDQAHKTFEEPFSILFFGRVEEYKGLKYLINAEPLVSKILPDFKIIVAGKGSDLKAHKSKVLSNPHFEVHDRFIPNQEVPSFFHRASVVVLPYIEASQSGIAAMAFAFGKPVIATDVGSIPEMVEHNRTGIIVPPKDEMALSVAILDLLTHPQKRKLLSQNTRKASIKKLNWHHIAVLTAEVYQTAIES